MNEENRGRSFDPTGSQVRPIIRCLARVIDYILFCVLTSIILASVPPSALEINNDLFGNIVLVFAYIFVESSLLASWGTTPGKALLNIRLRKQDGTKPSYSEALTRSCNVWVYGLGFGIPIVAIFTQINAYNKLIIDGITTWDRTGGFRIAHKLIGVGRMVVAIAICIVFMSLLIIN